MQELRGRFIVLDGPEGSGKSTQLQLLRGALAKAGLDVLAVRDPGTTRIGEQVRRILLDPNHREMSMRCEMLLYMSARAQMMKELILPALDAGKVVLCDRFVSSTLAYQLDGDGLTFEEILNVARISIYNRWPDLTIILDMPADKSLARVNRAKDRIEQRPMDYHEKVVENYRNQAQQMNVFNAEGCPIYARVDADQEPAQVHADILRALEQMKPNR